MGKVEGFLSLSIQRWISGSSPFQARVISGQSLGMWQCSGRACSLSYSHYEGNGTDEQSYDVLHCSLYCVGRGRLLRSVEERNERFGSCFKKSILAENDHAFKE